MITRNVFGLALSAVFLISVASNCDDGGNTLSSDGGNSGSDAEAGGNTGTGTGTGGNNNGGNGGVAAGGSSSTGGAVATGGAAAGGFGGQGTGGNATGGARTGGAPGTGGAPIVDLTCNPGASCQANATCNGACQVQQGGIGSRACSCVNGNLTCGMCMPVNVGNPMACPANPQGAACGGLNNCQIGQNPRNNCLCISNKLVCPDEAPPANTPDCVSNVEFSVCPTEGAYCARSDEEFCYCTSVGGNQRWLCRFRQ
ncbi:MAG: hypothetical protein SGI86_01225 [Deltaproteobacteria bacterium]|nr:hypothetical protein [Deltaproteobacteria bacterium]